MQCFTCFSFHFYPSWSSEIGPENIQQTTNELDLALNLMY